MTRRVSVVPHTHWDREWYSPFPAFRLRLVELLDELVGRLERDPAYARFLLDGQMAVVDDYLEVRPGAAGALRRLVSAGRLSVGPWYVLMDEFCVSAETMVRNLQLGLERAAGLGGAMPVGYLPDMFGHVAQMPQLLAAAGLAHAVVWRGVPAAVQRSAFWWRAPDGSTVRAEYLPVGYGNGAATPADAGALLRRLAAHQAEIDGFLSGEDDPMLWMNGTDHQVPQPWLPQVIDETNRAQKDFELAIVSLPEHLAAAPTTGLPTWSGELRSGARANLLMGVLSNRSDVKAAAAVAERALERRAEPLAALWLGTGNAGAGPLGTGDAGAGPLGAGNAGAGPLGTGNAGAGRLGTGNAGAGRLGAGDAPPGTDGAVGRVLEGAWRQVILNSAHDSICACSADAVGLAVLDRFAEATAAADAVAARSLAAAGAAMAAPGPVVVNPSARTRSGVVEVVLAGGDAPQGTQLIDAVPAGCEVRRARGGDLARLLGELVAGGWLPPTGAPTSASVVWADGELHLDLAVDRRHLAADPEVGPAMAEAWAQAGAGAERPLRVTVQRPPSVRVAARVAPVPGYGWAAWQPEPPGAGAVTGGPGWLDNGMVRVEVDTTTGTFSLNGLGGMDRLVDGGDEGDTYNYSPPDPDVIVDTPEAVGVEVAEAGPVRGRLAIHRRYRWPALVSAGRREGARHVEVRTQLELRAGEGLVRVATWFDNPCRDHRLRAVFPLPEQARHSVAECAFATVTRGLEAEGGAHERPLATFPSRRFVSAGGLTVTHEGLLEYELINGGRSLALTLLRATGFLSRPAPAWRPNAAGPHMAVEGPQMVGPVRVRYALAAGAADPYRLADDAWLPLEVVEAAGGGHLGPSGQLLGVAGAQVSALRRVSGGLELRVFNPGPEETVVSVDGRSGWLVDLRGRPLEPFSASFALRPWGIATALIGS